MSIPRRRSVLRRVALAAAMFVLPLGLSLGVFGDSCAMGSVEGSIVSRGEPFGDYTMQPTNCFSGEHESFFGVWVTPQFQEVEEGQGWKGGLKIVRSHTGPWEVYVESPNECESLDCKIRSLPTEHCSVFDVDVRNTNTVYNDIRVREGHANLKCSLPQGGSLSADLKFGGCR